MWSLIAPPQKLPFQLRHPLANGAKVGQGGAHCRLVSLQGGLCFGNAPRQVGVTQDKADKAAAQFWKEAPVSPKAAAAGNNH
jgi:hypothetical protein